MRRFTSAMALAGMAGGLVLSAAAPALAAEEKATVKPVAKPTVQSMVQSKPTTRQDMVQQLAQDYLSQLLGKIYMSPMPSTGMPTMGGGSPVNITCTIVKGPSVIDVSGLAAQICNVANGANAVVTGGAGFDKVLGS